MTKHENLYTPEQQEELLDAHVGTSLDTPLRSDAFDLSNEDKIVQIAEKFEDIMILLGLDLKDDSLSGTPLRVAKMYVNETMAGRFIPQPPVTAFPNDNAETRYGGMIVVRSEIRSMCSHHHQPVSGIAYIGLIPGVKVIGLSKYTRLAQHCARRGTLQEELTQDIANEISKHTGAKDIAVYIQGTHGCCENRGVMAHSSLTQTCELRGQFFNPSVKNEFLDYIKMQQQFAGNRT